MFIFSISCNALHLERNISLSAVRSLADKRFPLVMLCRFFLAFLIQSLLSANHVVLFVPIVYLGGLHCFVLYSAICTAQSKTAKVIIFCFLPSDQLGFYYIKFLFFSFFNAGNLAI